MIRKLALITGASSGLGVEFARHAAKSGHDLVLVARRRAELEAVAKEVTQAHGIEAHVMPADLADPTAPATLFEAVKSRGLHVDVLVNNAGFGSAGEFLDLPLEREVEMIEVNVQALVKLSHLFGQQMRERKSGAILNIASTAGFQPGPYMATYYASKAFVISFSEALGYELRGSGVTVTAHCPGATATSFARTAGNEQSRLFQQQTPASPARVAAHAWRAMEAGKPLAVQGAMNKVGVFGVRFSPRAVVRAIAASLNR